MKTDGNRMISMRDARKLATRRGKKMYVAALALQYMALLDKHGFTKDDVNRLFISVAELAIEVEEHRIKIDDIVQTLKEEYGLDLERVYNNQIH